MDAYGPETRIRSRANPVLKRVGAVLAGKDRSSVVLEGERLIADALAAGWRPEVLLRSSELPPSTFEREGDASSVLREVEPELLARLSALDTSPGWIALFPRPEDRAPEDLPLAADALVLVACGVQDPGNLGALSRSLEAAGGALLVTLEGGAGPWSAKALRGSMGSLLRMPHHRAPSTDGASELVRRLDALGFRHACAATRGGEDYRAFDWSGRVALWVTSETGDLPAALAGAHGLTIPMAPGVESLNVTVAASLLLFAAGRVPEGAE